jgi:hypothetical protein
LQLGGHAAAEMVGQHGHVALAHAQRGQGDHLEAQAVEQVGAEAALRGHARQVFVGGRHDAHVDPDRAAGADAGDFAIFDRAQQAFLRAHRERAEFVEEQRALVGFLEAARAGAGGAGEGPGLVPEKLGLDQGFGQGRAVHRDERFLPAGRQAVETLGDQFLAGSALADDQHRAAHGGGAAGALDRVEKGAGLADELNITFHGPRFGIFSQDWARYAMLQGAVFGKKRGFQGFFKFGTPVANPLATLLESLDVHRPVLHHPPWTRRPYQHRRDGGDERGGRLAAHARLSRPDRPRAPCGGFWPACRACRGHHRVGCGDHGRGGMSQAFDPRTLKPVEGSRFATALETARAGRTYAGAAPERLADSSRQFSHGGNLMGIFRGRATSLPPTSTTCWTRRTIPRR